jgi:segregation and condensation protein A
MEIKVKLDNFEGPFDLLLHLIDQRKMDPLKLVVSKIIDDYLSFLQEAKMEDLDIRVEFLVMASELLEIKALSVLNLSEKEKKEEELGQRIHEYKIFKGISRQLELFENEYNISYHKGKKGKNIVNRPSKEIDLSKLGIEDIFNTYLSQISETEEVLDININQTYTLSQEIENLNQNLKKHGKAEINDILAKAQNRLHIVYLFLAILEMYRNNLVKIDGKTIWLSEDF